MRVVSSEIDGSAADMELMIEKMTFVLDYLKELILPDIEEKMYHTVVQPACPTSIYTPTIRFHDRGRPKFDIDIDQVIHLRCIGFKWNDIAKSLGISIRTLHRRRQESSVGEFLNFTQLSDKEIGDQLLLFKEEFPDIGERMALGLFRSKGILIPRRRLRQAFHTVDTINTSLRWHLRIKRRTYSVPGAMSLWHIG